MNRKKLVRIVAFVLVAILALTLVPLGALAATVNVSGGITEKEEPKIWNIHTDWHEGTEAQKGSVTIKTSDYDSYIIAPDGQDYDLEGIVDMGQALKNPGEELDPKSSVTFEKYGWAMLLYTPHGHKLSRWYSDCTTPWRECLVCDHGDFIYQNWCLDGAGDGICDVCGGDVPYHDVTVVESEGGKITVNEDTAAYRTKITADVEPAEGYKLKKLHFVKIREDRSRQEITRRKENGQFWTLMPTCDLEVSAEFVKK